MRKKVTKKLLAILLSAAMLMSMSGCGNEDTDQSSQQSRQESSTQDSDDVGDSQKEDSSQESEDEAVAYDHLDRITIYPYDASTASGVTTGYKADVLAERGLEVEVWAWSEEKTNAILSSGDLPDIMFVKYDNLQTMIEGGMVLNLEEYLDKMPHITGNETVQTALNYTRQYKSADTGSIYGIPLQIGTTKEGDDTGRNAIKVNWAAYYAAGCPEIKSVDDLIPVMKKMMEVTPESAVDGTKTWGTILNAGSDGTYWGNMQLWYKFFGYEPDNLPYLIESDMVNNKYDSILELSKDSLYYKGLKWYNECYREGVMDPDSINNDRETQKGKVETSQACMIPSGTCAGWAGYRPVYVPGQQLYQENWVKPYGTDMYAVISAKSQNVDAAVRMLDFMADYDAYFEIWCGPEGILWEFGDDGFVYPTEYGIESATNEAGTPVEFNGEERVVWLDSFIATDNYEDSKYKRPSGEDEGARGLDKWEEILEIKRKSEENTQWVETFGYDTFTELLKANNAYTLNSDLANVIGFCPEPDDAMKLSIDAIKDTVVETSWKMVYAEDDATFETLWEQMIADCKELDAENIVSWRLDELNKAMDIKKSLEAN